MRYRQITILLLVIMAATTAAIGANTSWSPDVLGDGYEMCRIALPNDYSGKVQATLVRKLSSKQNCQHRAVLYIHGFNDYFFNDSMGNRFTNNGYNFYALDLRKYGRSLLPGQRQFEVRSLKEYFPEINAALTMMRCQGAREIVLMGHSTGGLIAAYFLALNPHAPVDALILNSPFLDWNLGRLEPLVPWVSWWGGFAPDTEIAQGHSTAYAESLLTQYHGRWNYNTEWKMENSPNVTAGWIRAISQAQYMLQHCKVNLKQPVLLMFSDNSVSGGNWTPAHNRGDAVLDVADIRRYGLRLGRHVTALQVNGGLHDLLLSNQQLLQVLYPRIFSWLAENLH
jgi:alpha-beta hydrolase superfamily lysophospholipase